MGRTTEQQVRIFDRRSPVAVLGPYQRAVVWVQGCGFACRGCIVPESWDREGGEVISVEALAAWILAQPGIEGITLSGGEPLLQAAALGAVIAQVRQVRDLGVMCYTGDRYERLRAQGTAAQRALLAQVDLLVDGPYQEAEHDDLLWRGSRNQRLVLLTERYRAVVTGLLAQGDASAGMEFYTTLAGELAFTGVPAQAGFRPAFEARLRDRGIQFQPL